MPEKVPRRRRSKFLLCHLSVRDGLFSNLEIVFCVFPAENNFVKALIPFIGVTSPSSLGLDDYLVLMKLPKLPGIRKQVFSTQNSPLRSDIILSR